MWKRKRIVDLGTMVIDAADISYLWTMNGGEGEFNHILKVLFKSGYVEKFMYKDINYRNEDFMALKKAMQ